MTTKLYFHAASNTNTGTFPTTPQDASSPDWTATGGNTLRAMNTTIGVSQASLAGSTLAQTTAQIGFYGYWCSAPLNGAQTFGGGAITISVADSESNLNANVFLSRANVYVWRPSTGAKVGTILQATFAGGPLEPTSASSEQVSVISSGGGSNVTAADGDVIIFEAWTGSFAEAMATSYTATLFYDGTTENTTENAVVSNHASFIQLAETLAFKGAATTAVGSSSGIGAAIGVGASTAASPGSSSGLGTATGVGKSLAESVGTSAGSSTVSATGTNLQPAIGSAAGASTVSATGASAAKSVGSAAGASAAAGVSPSATTDAVGTAAGTSTASAVGTNVTPIPAPTVYYQGAGHPGKHLRRRKRRDLFDAIEATLRESVYGPDEPDETTPEIKPAVREAVSQLEQISQGNADLLDRLAVLKAELADYRKIQAEKEKLKRLELIRQQEEDDEEAWLMVA